MAILFTSKMALTCLIHMALSLFYIVHINCQQTGEETPEEAPRTNISDSMVEFSCSSLDRKLAPGENTKVFDVTIPNLPDFYFNCTGVQRCFVRNQLIVALAKGKIIQSMISDAMISEIRMLTCKEDQHFLRMNSIGSINITDKESGYILLNKQRNIRDRFNINVTFSSESANFHFNIYYMKSNLNNKPLLMKISEVNGHCVQIEEGQDRRHIETITKAVTISSCSNDGMFGISFYVTEIADRSMSAHVGFQVKRNGSDETYSVNDCTQNSADCVNTEASTTYPPTFNTQGPGEEITAQTPKMSSSTTEMPTMKTSSSTIRPSTPIPPSTISNEPSQAPPTLETEIPTKDPQARLTTSTSDTDRSSREPLVTISDPTAFPDVRTDESRPKAQQGDNAAIIGGGIGLGVLLLVTILLVVLLVRWRRRSKKKGTGTPLPATAPAVDNPPGIDLYTMVNKVPKQNVNRTSLTITENDLYASDNIERRISGVFIVENSVYS